MSPMPKYFTLPFIQTRGLQNMKYSHRFLLFVYFYVLHGAKTAETTQFFSENSILQLSDLVN